jgi:hypothetical protein
VVTLVGGGVLWDVTPAVANAHRVAVPSSATPAPLTPIVAQQVFPPSAMTGSDGRRHLAYEVLLTDASPRPASITALTVRAGSSRGPVLQVLDARAIGAVMGLLGNLSGTQSTSLPPYSTGQVVLDTVLPKSGPTPARLALTLSATFQAPLPGQSSIVSIFPDSVTEQLPAVTVSTNRPIIVDNPMTGGDWVAINACCSTFNAHRGGLIGGAGRPVSGERYAIDFIRTDTQAQLYKPGAPPALSNNYSYGAHVSAVTDGTVVGVQEGLPDQPPDTKPTGLTLNEFGGNQVVVKLRPDVYAFYAHFVPGTIKVHVGQRVHTGQLLGALGNSGNSSAPHLHFQLMDGPSPLTSEGLPFEFRSLTLLANAGVNGAGAPEVVPLQPPRVLHGAYPLENTVIGFPGGSSAPVQPDPLPAPGSSGPDG